MGFYLQFVLPRFLDWSLSDSNLAKYRQELLANVKGEVLEIGFRTGLNLAYYPKHIHKITTVDTNYGMNAFAKKRISNSNITVEQLMLSSENIPVSNNTFDSVAITFVLCSINYIEKALKEVNRVLKPGGRFFFLEHGSSDKPNIQVWQDRLTPIQKFIAGGCHLNRNIEEVVKRHFDRVKLKQFTPENMSDLTDHLYQGIATK